MIGYPHFFFFSITISDTQHWTPEHLKECEESVTNDSKNDEGWELPYTFDDWAANQLKTKMREAGMQFIRENSDLFVFEDME